MNDITKKLFELQDKTYRDIQISIIPNINPDTIIGVRCPLIRSYAKELVKTNNYKSFLEDLPHKYFDENQLHSSIITEIKDYDECIKYINEFLPYVDNWATCDQLIPKVFKKNSDKLITNIKKWINSKDAYAIRFGVGTLMRYCLNENFREEHLKLVSNIKSDEYYVNMMRAWYFATALAKQYESTIPFIENKKLDVWTHNKTIQKSIESYRITNEHKEYLRSLKIK